MRVNTFLATHRRFGGTIRVVIVQEKAGPGFFCCTDVTASVREILEAFADRSAIEQAPEDAKLSRREGRVGQRPVLGPDCADDAARRPSHAEHRKALWGHLLATGIHSHSARTPHLAKK